MECFDRIGERAKLSTAIDIAKGVCLVTGQSGVGKSKIIASVLRESIQSGHILQYEFGRNPLPLSQYLLVCLRESTSSRSKFLHSIQNLSVGEISISIPFVGKAPIKWGSQNFEVNTNKLPFADISLAIDGPLFEGARKLFKKTASYLEQNDVTVIWISNTELATPTDFGDICLAARLLGASIPIVVEHASRRGRQESFESALTSVCERSDLPICHIKVQPFNVHFAKGLYDHLDLGKHGVAFNYMRTGGYPAAIKFDLEESVGPSSISNRLQECLDHSADSAATLLLLTVLHSVENRYERIIDIADKFGIELSFEKLIEADLVSLSDKRCELAHPRIAQFLALTRRQEIYQLLRSYYETASSNDAEIDLAALGYAGALTPAQRFDLFERGVAFVLDALAENRMHVADSALSFIEVGYEESSIQTDLPNEMIGRKVALLRRQIDTLLCRESGALTNPADATPVDLLLEAQARMRGVDLPGAIALTEAVEASLTTTHLSDKLNSWTEYCARYTRLSCLIAQGNFSKYGEEYSSMAQDLATSGELEHHLFQLLPPNGKGLGEVESTTLSLPKFLSARLTNNEACSLLFRDCTNPKIKEMLTYALSEVADEGSVEVTFPMNNLGLYLLYSNELSAALDIFYDMISYSIYPYDYFAAFNNFSIALAANGQFDEGVEFAEKAHNYITRKELQDPVFAIKSHFNIAVLRKAAGDSSKWRRFSEMAFATGTLPTRYGPLVEHKKSQIDEIQNLPAAFQRIEGNGIEGATLLWPQNLAFWDFMYPVVTHAHIDEMIRA